MLDGDNLQFLDISCQLHAYHFDSKILIKKFEHFKNISFVTAVASAPRGHAQ